jgi:hypothetical protein
MSLRHLRVAFSQGCRETDTDPFGLKFTLAGPYHTVGIPMELSVPVALFPGELSGSLLCGSIIPKEVSDRFRLAVL